MPEGGNRSDITSFVSRLTQSVRYVVSGVTPETWMGPMQPLQPMAPGEVAGRQFDYPVGYNLDVRPRKNLPVTFEQLRWLSSSWPVLRTIIERRKDQVEALDWQVVAAEGSKLGPDSPQVKNANLFLKRPCPDKNWQAWLRMLLEDLFVLDAVALYRWPNRGGGLFALEPVDGATINVVIDGSGRVPLEGPAYQQILKGIPAVDYTREELYYRMRNPRTNSVYGLSPVEQIILTVNIALRRDMYNLDYYTEGNIPPAIAAVPKEWSPDHIKAYQTHWDSMMVGNLAQKRRMRFVPGDVKVQQLVDSPAKDAFDEWLTRIACYAFSVSPQAFVKDQNRATAETAKSTADEEGLQPLKKWLKGLMDDILLAEFGPELEFKWMDDAATDAKKEAETDAIYVQNGIKTRDEVRDKMGLERLGGEAAQLTTNGSVTTVYSLRDDQGEKMPEKPAPVDVAAGVSPDGQKSPADDSPASSPRTKAEPPAAGEPNDKKEAAKSGTLKKLQASLGFIAEPGHAAAVDALAPALIPVLDAVRDTVVAQLQAELFKAEETPEEQAARLAEAADLSELETMAVIVVGPLGAAATRAGWAAFTNTGLIAGDGMFDQVNEMAVEFAELRAAELVTEISDATRNMLRASIAQGLSDNLGLSGVVAQLQSAYAFSAARAQLIAETEIGNANGAGRLVGLQQAEDIGVVVKKKWLAEAGACDACLANAKQGPIALAKAFQSGHMAPLAHPRCRCDMVGVVEG